MNKNDCFCLGKILKTFGYKGDVVVLIQAGIASDYEKLGSVFVEIDNKLIPFFISSVECRSEDLLQIHFEDIESPDDARKIVGKEAWLPQEQLPESIDDMHALPRLIGYKVIDKEKGFIGTLSGYIEMTHQDVLRVQSGLHEILLPAVSQIVYKIDRRKKEIYVEAPNGLIDLYLQ